MNTRSPWRNGVVLALTIAIGYTACTVIFALAPEQGIDFVNALFHGLDFHKLGTPEPFTFPMFFYPLVVLVVWGFLVGAVYAWLCNRLLRGPA